MADARAQVTADGKVFDAEDTVILQQVASGKTQSPTALTTYQYSMDGSDVKSSSATLSMNDTVVRSRSRPTAYVIPKDIPNAGKDPVHPPESGRSTMSWSPAPLPS